MISSGTEARGRQVTNPSEISSQGNGLDEQNERDQKARLLGSSQNHSVSSVNSVNAQIFLSEMTHDPLLGTV
jgi:hypothetical protein